MVITLEENDSFIQPDGQATMIVVAVKKDDGKIIRFPYAANRSMSALIQDVNEKIGSAPVCVERPVEKLLEFARAKGEAAVNTIRYIESEASGDNRIKKEDLVKCIKLLPRDKDAPIDMSVGGIYRVLALPTGKVPYYEVIDDTDFHKADVPRRVAAFPEEIQFFQKRKNPIPKEIGSFEEIFPCPICNKRVSCNRLDDNKYHGVCEDCNHEIVSDIKRQEVAQ